MQSMTDFLDSPMGLNQGVARTMRSHALSVGIMRRKVN